MMLPDDTVHGRQSLHQRLQVLATSLQLQLLTGDRVDQRADPLQLLQSLDVPATAAPSLHSPLLL